MKTKILIILIILVLIIGGVLFWQFQLKKEGVSPEEGIIEKEEIEEEKVEEEKEEIAEEEKVELPKEKLACPYQCCLNEQYKAKACSQDFECKENKCVKRPVGPVKIHNQNISGEIKQDQIWSGTIHVTGDVKVKEGVTLTILPSTNVIITAHQDDQHGDEVDPGLEAESPEAIAITLKAGYPPKDDEYVKSHVTIEIKGTLNAIGTQENRIIFTSDNASPTTYDWYKLRIWDGNLEYVVVEYARMVTIEGPNVKISNNIIRHMLEGAISIGFLDKTASPIISNNEIYDCGNECIHITSGSVIITNNTLRPGRERMLPGYGGTGIVIWDMYWDWLGIDTMGNPVIENNLIEEANWNGIAYRSATSSPIIRYNTIRNSTTGINFERSGTGSPVIFYNNIYNNEDNNINNMVNQTFNLSNNWWGTTDTSEIDAKIWDYADDPNLGKINYNPILNAPVEEAEIIETK